MAELRLDVTLNLAGFRAQLEKLATEAGARYFGVKLSIDGTNFKKQLQLLEKIKPVITINDSQLIAARERIGALNKSLVTLRKATSAPIEIKVKYVEQGKPPTGAISKSGTFRQRLTGLDAEPIKQLYAAAGKAGLVQFDAEIAKNKSKIITALNQAGESSVAGLLNGLKSKDSAVKTAAKSLGDILIAALKLSLQIQSPSKKMEAIGEYAGEGFNKGLKDSLNEAKASAVNAMRGIVAALRIEAAKIQNISLAPGSLRSASAPASLRGGSRGGRGYFNPIGPLPEGSKEPYTMTNRGYQPYLGGPGIGSSAAPRGLLPPSSAIGRGFSGQSFAGAPINFRMGADLPALPSSEAAERLRQQDQVAQGTAGRLRQQARVAQAHLRSAERSATVFGERAARLDKAMSAFRTSGRTTGYTSPIGPLPRDSAEPYAAGSRGMFGKEGFEARLESRPVAGLLSPSLTPTREQIVAARTQIARQRSDARALDAQVENQFRQTQFNPTVPPRQYFQPNTQPLLPGGGVAPSRGGSLALRAGGGGGGMPAGGGGNPPGPPSGGGNAPVGGGGVPPRSGGGGAFGGMQFAMPQLPGRGIVQELGTEFAFAAKQVLLFGAAYKALAFITDFPSQVGSAVGQLQSFRNTLKSITPSTAEFGQSSQFILSLVDQYNIPLQSARDGFAKLYASMQPAGFSGKEIRDLFEGVSMGAATFGMSADKVDRVMYAFAQMASKGQVMSEELKGQLGDVLPGSLALFAKAAKMSVAQFSQAMEDGAFKGNAMRELLIKVGATMKEEFGKGAVGAAATFQGVMNRLQTSTTLFYEAFEPAAVAFSNTFVLPLTNGLRVVTDAFTQLMTGQKAVTVSGSDLAAQMQPFIPIFQGIGKNLAQVGQAALGVAKSLGPIIQLILQLLASPIVGWLAQAYTSVILLQGAFTLLGGRAILGAIAGLAQYSIGAARAALVSQTMASQALSAQMQLRLLASGAATTGVAISTFAVAVRTAFITTAAGAVVVAVGMMISEFMRLRGVMDDIEGRYKSVADQARMMGQSGSVSGLEKLQNDAIEQANTYEEIEKGLQRGKKGKENSGITFVDQKTADLMKQVGQQSLLGPGRGILDRDKASFRAAINLNRQNYKENQKIIDQQKKKAELKEKELKAGGSGTGTKETEDDKKRKAEEDKLAKSQDTLATRQQQLDQDAANRRVALDQSIFDSRLRMSDADYDHQRALQDSYFERQISGLDSIEARQKKFQQDLKAIEDRRIDSIRKAELDAVKAVQDLRTANIKATAVTGDTGGTVGGTGGRYMQGGIGPKGKNQYGDHFHISRSDQANFGRSTLDKYVSVNDKPLSSGLTVKGGEYGAGREGRSHTGIDYAFPRGAALSLKEGAKFTSSSQGSYGDETAFQTPDGKVYKILHGNFKSETVGSGSSSVGLNTRSGAFTRGRREDKAEGNLAVEQQEVQIKAQEKLETIRRANNLALEQTITLVKQNIDSIFPVKEQKLENDLLEMRNNLELKGTSKEIIDMEVQKYKAVKENAYNLQVLNERIAKNNEELTKLKGKKITTPDDEEQIKSLTNSTAAYNLEIAGIPEKQRLFNEQLERTAALAVESPMVKLAKQVNEAKRELVEMSSASSMAIGGAKSIGEAFGNSFKDMITGSKTVKESFASLFQSVGDYFLDMAGRIISKYIEMQAIQGLMSIFSMFAPGAAPGVTPGAAPVPSNLQPGADFGLPGMISTGMVTAANGAVWQGGFTAFASGGIVQGPTLGLVGEGRYNEAIIPLPDGKSVPVDLGGMSDGLGNNITSNIVVNVNSDGQSTSNANGSNSVDLGRKIEGAVKQVIVAELRPGGVLAGRR